MMAVGSIRNRLLWSILAGVGFIWMAAILISYVDAHRELDQLFDAHLAQAARILSAQAGHELTELEPLEQEELQQYATQFAFQIWSERGELLMRMGGAPSTRFSHVAQGFSDSIVDGVHWRIHSEWDATHELLIQMAEPHSARERLARRIAFNALLPSIAALPLIGALIWWTVTSGLAPLRRLGEELAHRDALALERLALPAPREVQPLVRRLNALFERIEQSIENEKRFTADAAHELRNPVAALRAQAEAAIGSADPAAAQRGLRLILESSTRLSRLVDQLLALARVDAKASAAQLSVVDLAALLRRTLAELAPHALQAGAVIVCDAPQSVAVRGDAALLEIAIRNLVENAVRYGGERVQIHASLGQREGRIELSIQDDGPGVAAAELEHLGERFFRGRDQRIAGSGLGLSIVRRIAELHEAAMRFEAGPAGRGLLVRLSFPAVVLRDTEE